MSKKVDLVIVVKRNDNITGFLGINEYLGLGYIKAFLREKGVQAHIHIVFNDEVKNISGIFKQKPSIVGFPMYSDIVDEVMEAARFVKECYSDAHVTIGGPQVFGFEEDILKKNRFVDSVISGEGEITFHELVERIFSDKDFEGVQGLTYRSKDGEVTKSEERPPIQDLDKLPFPDRDIFELERQEYFYIAGARGCMGTCSFCSETAFKKHQNPPFVRIRSAKNIVDEMEYLIKRYDLNCFRFTDATFEDPGEAGRKKAEEVFDEIIRRNLNVSFHIFTRAELVTEESREYLRTGFRAGLECAYVGVESANREDIRLYNKNATIEQNYRALRIIKEEGILPTFGFINFNPYSTYDRLLQNAEFLYNSGLGHVFYLHQTRLEVLAQSVIRKKMINDGLLRADADYRTHFYDYVFADTKIGELYEVVKKATQKTPIYYMDTILGTHRVWVYRHVNEDERWKFDELFNKLDEIRKQKSELNYDFFKTCIEMSKSGATRNEMEEYSRDKNLDLYFDEFMNLYFKINVKVTKQRIKLYGM